MRQFGSQILRFLRLDFLLIFLSNIGYLLSKGWLKSNWYKKPVDRSGKPIPWLTYGAIYFLNQKLTKSMSIFEFGSGGSTLWFSERVKSVISIENDQEWFETINKNLPQNVKYYHIETPPMPYSKSAFLPLGEAIDNYCSKIMEFDELFDLIIIDGIDRNNCVKYAIKKLAPNGIIIFDNCEYEKEFSPGIGILHKSGFKNIEFRGLSPGMIHESSTGIFYRQDNCFNI